MSNQSLLSGKIALVTGGTSGIGHTTAMLYAKEGARLVITGRNKERGDAVVAEIKAKTGSDAVFFQGDISNTNTIKEMMDFTLNTYGQLDIAFNNAGISGPIKPLLDITLDEWYTVQNTNLTSVFLCLQHEIRQMIKQGGGVIVNHASLAALQGMPMVASYSAAKHGVAGLTRTAALEYCNDNIRVNAICPGSIDTPLLRASAPGAPDEVLYQSIPMQRLGSDSEVAETVLWLSSSKSSFITGQTLAIDGGESVGRPIPKQ